MRKIYAIFLLIIVASATAPAQSPKREMRATWLTTVWRNDWPSTTVPTATGSNDAARQSAINTQKNGLISILDRLQSENINAVFFQIRSMCDALYPSSYEPWSQWISTERGSDPGWDPLAFAVEEAHKRGMELHAWINPYRYSSGSSTYGTLSNDYAVANPSWLIDYGSSAKILNPGMPEVIQRISDIVAEVVANYNIDGIVFDDYFYMSGTTNAMDQAQYNAFNPSGLDRGDWRRANVNKMVKAVYDRIQSLKPYVTFGISPAGVAASNSVVAAKYSVPPSPVGSDWQYNDIFSDPLAWLQEGSIDYISPQIYWTIGSANDYAQLCEWWSFVANRFNKQFYSSHSLTAMESFPAPPAPDETLSLLNEDIPLNALSSLERMILQQPEENLFRFGYSEIGRQVDYNRNYDLNGAPGSVFFATAKSTVAGFISYMSANQFHYKAIPPAIGWKQSEMQRMVSNLSLSGQTLNWTYDNEDVRYAVYAVPTANSDNPQVFASSFYLQGISYTKQYTLPTGISSASHRIAVSVIDRYGNEFSPRILGENTSTPAAAELINPADGASVVLPALFTWKQVPEADSYVYQIAGDAGFNDLISSRETVEPNFNSSLLGNLKEDTHYYWRVKTLNPNAGDTWSDTRSFNAEFFKIISPENGSDNVPLTPTFTWSDIGETADYTLEISTTNQFQSLVYSATVQTTNYTVPENKLVTATTYYARVKATLGSLQATSATISFTLIELDIPVPQIISPANESVLNGTSIIVNWQEQTSRGFRIELAPSATFSPLTTKLKTAGAFDFSTQYDNLSAGVYYIRVAAQKQTGLTAYSEIVKVTLNDGTDLKNVTLQTLEAYIANGNLTVKSAYAGPINIAVYNLTGQLLSASDYMLQAGINTIPLNDAQLSKGVYLIRLKTAEKCLTLKILR